MATAITILLNNLDNSFEISVPLTYSIYSSRWSKHSHNLSSAGTDDILPSLTMSYTSTEYTPVHRGPLEEGHKDILSGVSNDLQTTLQYVAPLLETPNALLPVTKC